MEYVYCGLICLVRRLLSVNTHTDGAGEGGGGDN